MFGGEVVEGGVVVGGSDGVGGDVDVDGVGEYGGESDCEEVGVGVGVDKIFDWGGGVGGVGWGWENVGVDEVSEGFEDGVVVLEEGVGGVGEGIRIDMFGDGGMLVGFVVFDFDVRVGFGFDGVRWCFCGRLFFFVFGEFFCVFM